jgi:hypothetical protein
MLKYLTEAADNLTARKRGIAKNSAVWTATGITKEAVAQEIARLQTAEAELNALQTELAKKQTEAHTLRDAADVMLMRIDNYAFALHANERARLADYGLQADKAKKSKPAPSMKLGLTIEDDTDGAGFILTTTRDPLADRYEWYKGIAADAKTTEVIPAMTLFKTTRKISFTDNDVKQGERVFYKVRAVNTAGDGPWSDAASKVQ